jgi:hypothetical protein
VFEMRRGSARRGAQKERGVDVRLSVSVARMVSQSVSQSVSQV